MAMAGYSCSDMKSSKILEEGPERAQGPSIKYLTYCGRSFLDLDLDPEKGRLDSRKSGTFFLP